MKYGFKIFLVLLCLLALVGVGVNGAEKNAWELIDWNKPVPMVKRLTADEYILPAGWKNATKGITELVFYNSGGLSGDIATAINMKLFEKKTGIRVKAIELAPDQEYIKTLSTFLAKDKSVPLLLANQSEVSFYAAGRWSTPVDHLYPSEVVKLYSPALKEMLYFDGHWWGSPFTCLGNGVVYYRPSWLKKAGVEVPDSWEDLFVAAKKCREWARNNLGDSYYGVIFPGYDFEQRILAPAVFSQGGVLVKNGRFQFDSSEFRRVFTAWVQTVKEDIAPKEALNFGWQPSANAFGMGKAAFGAGTLTSYLMKYETEFPVIKGDWEALPPLKWSAGSPEKYRTGTIESNVGLVNKFADDKKQALAMLFLDFLRSKEAQRNELVVEANESFMVNLYDDPTLAAKVDWRLADSVAEALGIPHPKHVTDLPYKRIRKTIVQYGRINVVPPSYPQVLVKMREVFPNAGLGKISIDEAIKQLIDFAERYQ
ncbi:MAG TPA: extracellular solute-binding protein [Firmicutes bacterium]|nr:extracellular solute-binding protein [Bacillota bacterium]